MVKETKHKDYCSRCKTGKAEIKYSLKNNTQYYHCRKCNTERCMKYRRTEKGAENFRNAVYKSISRYPERQKARIKLNYEVRIGRIKRGDCKVCGEKNAHAHHTDYSKPLDVEWLCRACHADEHKKSKS